MIKRLKLICSESNIPYYNLALEEYIINNIKSNECILYLWQNKNTVVIGRNQNAWRECRCESLKADGGFLARRLSGGGAVYHDMGNLNFTIFANKEDFDIPKQTDMIIYAVKLLGIDAEKTGRNDITVNGRKISGNAYYETSCGCCHHGTIMVDVDKEKLTKYLNTDKKKLQSNGVSSVEARVGNLSEYKTDITIQQVKAAVKAAFEEIYGGKCERLYANDINSYKLKALEEKYSSSKWLYGRKIKLKNNIEGRFEWGSVQIEYNVSEGMLSYFKIYSDTLYPDITEKISQALEGKAYSASSVKNAVNSLKADNLTQKSILKDISNLLSKNIL